MESIAPVRFWLRIPYICISSFSALDDNRRQFESFINGSYHKSMSSTFIVHQSFQIVIESKLLAHYPHYLHSRKAFGCLHTQTALYMYCQLFGLNWDHASCILFLPAHVLSMDSYSAQALCLDNQKTLYITPKNAFEKVDSIRIESRCWNIYAGRELTFQISESEKGWNIQNFEEVVRTLPGVRRIWIEWDIPALAIKGPLVRKSISLSLRPKLFVFDPPF